MSTTTPPMTDEQADRVDALMGRYPATHFHLVAVDQDSREATFEASDFCGETSFVMSADGQRVLALPD